MELKFRQRIVFLITGSAVLLNALSWFIIWKKFPPSEIPYAVHYSVLSGADIFGTMNMLLILPFLGLVIIGINITIAFLMRKKEIFLSYIFLIISFLIQIFLLIALFALLKFNGLI